METQKQAVRSEEREIIELILRIRQLYIEEGYSLYNLEDDLVNLMEKAWQYKGRTVWRE